MTPNDRDDLGPAREYLAEQKRKAAAGRRPEPPPPRQKGGLKRVVAQEWPYYLTIAMAWYPLRQLFGLWLPQPAAFGLALVVALGVLRPILLAILRNRK